jgi:hypothetical protein
MKKSPDRLGKGNPAEFAKTGQMLGIVPCLPVFLRKNSSDNCFDASFIVMYDAINYSPVTRGRIKDVRKFKPVAWTANSGGAKLVKFI